MLLKKIGALLSRALGGLLSPCSSHHLYCYPLSCRIYLNNYSIFYFCEN